MLSDSESMIPQPQIYKKLHKRDTLESLWIWVFVCFKLPHAYVKSFISVIEENVVF